MPSNEEDKKMFKNRYLTCGVQSSIPPEIISFMWCLIDDLLAGSHEVNSLQVFDLWEGTDGMGKLVQMVTHTQEEYKAIYDLYLPINPIRATIFVIDDFTHATMLLAQEY